MDGGKPSFNDQEIQKGCIMKLRHEYDTKGDQLNMALDRKKTHGGWVACCYKNNAFNDDGSKWLERILWYNPDHTRIDIINELHGFDEVTVV